MRAKPFLEEAEMALLGSMFAKAKVIGQVIQVVPGEAMFYLSHHKLIFKAMVDLYRQGHPIDVVMLKDMLLDRQQLQTVGGEDYLIQIMEAVPSAENALYYANIVREKWAERTIVNRIEKTMADYNAGEQTFDGLFKSASEITRGRLMPNQFAFHVSAAQVGPSEYIDGLYTGIPSIDSLTSMGGIPRSQMTTIGAKTGGGKSFIAQQIARNVAERDERVGYLCFGGDLDTQMLRARWIKQATGITPHRHMKAEEEPIVRQAFEDLAKLPITVYESAKATDARLETAFEWVESEHRGNPFSLVIVDYAQEIKIREKVSGPVERMEEVAKLSSVFAKQLGCGLIMLSQLVDEDSLNFRYSQQFRHSSGLAVVLQRSDTELLSGLFDVKATVVKNRWGFDGGTFEGHWNPKRTRFEL